MCKERKIVILIVSLFISSILFFPIKSVKSQTKNEKFAQALIKYSENRKISKKSSRFNTIRSKLNSNTVTIVLSAESDAQIQITRDLMDVMRQKNIRLLPIIAKGGTQNALDIIFLKGVDVGIIQSDILAHLRGKNWFLYNDIFERIHYITKLYNAEWHLLGRKQFKNIRDLKGMRVNISTIDSGTYITSRNIFELLGVKVKYTNYSNNIALQKLKNGEIDAMAMIAGAPISSFVNIPKNDSLHFIPTTFLFDDPLKTPLKNVLSHFYFPSYLTHEQYPNLIPAGGRVSTVANSIVFAVYNWDKSRDVNRRKKVASFISIFFDQFNQFKQTGRHAKWKEVNLAANVNEWQRASDVRKILGLQVKLNKSGTIKNDKAFAEFNKFLKDVAKIDFSKLPREEQVSIYRQFLKFKENR